MSLEFGCRIAFGVFASIGEAAVGALFGAAAAGPSGAMIGAKIGGATMSEKTCDDLGEQTYMQGYCPSMSEGHDAQNYFARKFGLMPAIYNEREAECAPYLSPPDP